MMTWLTRSNERKNLVSFLKSNSEAIKLKYQNSNKQTFIFYKFKKENSKNPADDLYVIFPHKTRGTKYNLYYHENRETRKTRNALKSLNNNPTLDNNPKFKNKHEKNTFLDLKQYDTPENRHPNFKALVNHNLKNFNRYWRCERRKVDLVAFAFKIENQKLIHIKNKLCIKKACDKSAAIQQEIEYIKMFECSFGYKPQLIHKGIDDYYCVVILMKYLGKNLREHIKRNYFKNKDKDNLRKNIIYKLAIEIKKAHQMHQEKTVHGDLKPQNIVVNIKNNIVTVHIIDYGNTGHVGSDIDPEAIKQAIKINYRYWPIFVFEEFTKQCKTISYEKVKIKRTTAFDIFSLGVVIWEIYGGKFWKYKKILEKYKKSNYYEVEKRFSALILMNLKKAKVSNQIKALVPRMISINPKEVPSIDEVIKHFAPKP